MILALQDHSKISVIGSNTSTRKMKFFKSNNGPESSTLGKVEKLKIELSAAVQKIIDNELTRIVESSRQQDYSLMKQINSQSYEIGFKISQKITQLTSAAMTSKKIEKNFDDVMDDREKETSVINNNYQNVPSTSIESLETSLEFEQKEPKDNSNYSIESATNDRVSSYSRTPSPFNFNSNYTPKSKRVEKAIVLNDAPITTRMRNRKSLKTLLTKSPKPIKIKVKKDNIARLAKKKQKEKN